MKTKIYDKYKQFKQFQNLKKDLKKGLNQLNKTNVLMQFSEQDKNQ